MEQYVSSLGIGLTRGMEDSFNEVRDLKKDPFVASKKIQFIAGTGLISVEQLMPPSCCLHDNLFI